MKNQNIKRIIAVFCFTIGIVTPFFILKNLIPVSAYPLTPPVTPPITPPTVTPTPTPTDNHFRFISYKTDVLANERFILNWVWDNLSNPASSVTFTVTVPSGISLNYNSEQCRSGNGCEITYTMYKGVGAGQTMVADAFGLYPGQYTLATRYSEVNGSSGVQMINITVRDNVTPTPTSTPTPIPTIVVPTVTPTPTIIIPTVTPTVKPNRKPIIDIKSLPRGMVGKPYYTLITATDPDKDRVYMNIKGLPRGLAYGCMEGMGMGRCWIYGTPTTIGNYSIRIKASDNRGGETVKNLPLKIVKSSKDTK